MLLKRSFLKHWRAVICTVFGKTFLGSGDDLVESLPNSYWNPLDSKSGCLHSNIFVKCVGTSSHPMIAPRKFLIIAGVKRRILPCVRYHFYWSVFCFWRCEWSTGCLHEYLPDRRPSCKIVPLIHKILPVLLNFP